MNILWYVVIGLVCYTGVVMLIDFLVAKFRGSKEDYFKDSKGGDYNENDIKKKIS